MSVREKTWQGYDLIRVSSSITRPANQTQYAVDEAVSDATGNAHYTFTRALKEGAKGGEILVARLSTTVPAATPLLGELWLFHTDIANVADNASWTLTDAELLTRVAVVDFPVASWRINANNACCDVVTRIPFIPGAPLAAGGYALYGQLVAQNTFTPAANSEVLTVELIIAQY